MLLVLILLWSLLAPGLPGRVFTVLLLSGCALGVAVVFGFVPIEYRLRLIALAVAITVAAGAWTWFVLTAPRQQEVGAQSQLSAPVGRPIR